MSAASEASAVGEAGAAGEGTYPGAEILSRLTLSRGTVDRSAHRRTDTGWLDAAWAGPRTRVLVIDDGRALVRFRGEGAELVLVPPGQAPDGLRFLLGVDADGVVYFGVLGPLPEGQHAWRTGRARAPSGRPAARRRTCRRWAAAGERGRMGRWAAVRGARGAAIRGRALGDRDAGLMTHAAGQLARGQHAPLPVRGGDAAALLGHARRCPVDGSDHSRG